MQKGDVPATFSDSSKLFEWVKFKPNTPVKEGVSKFVEWYKYFYKEVNHHMKINNLPKLTKCTISIIGLGYVYLPLAVEFAKIKKCWKTKKSLDRNIIGDDLNEKRINELNEGIDKNKEIPKSILNSLNNLVFTNDPELLSASDVFIITVPTPIDEYKKPDLEYIKSASKIVGQALKKRNNYLQEKEFFVLPVVIYESTVYPGTTEDICIPILEKESGLIFNNEEPKQSFACGYSPERINPGDKIHTLSSIIKVTSGGDEISSMWINSFYASIIEEGTYPAKSIKIAEAAKIIENTQRDINIALINELSIILISLILILKTY